MTRTPEQKAADAALTTAIENVMRAYIGNDEDDDDPGLLMDYLVLGARQGIGADGERWSTTVAFTRDDNVPAHTQLGLMDMRSAYLRNRVRARSECDDD